MKKAARFSIEILSLLLLMSHFLAGCSEEYGYNSEVAATESATPAPTIIDEDAAETVPSSGEELHMLTAQQGIAMTVGGETANGCYSLDPYPDASADIIYYDYLTQECIRLSADANLGHDPASTAYIPSFKGGARCFVVGNYLYVIKNGQPYTDASVSGNDPTARIYSMALDGSDRKIQEYGSNVVFNWFGGVAGNGTDALFTIVSIVDPQKAEVKSALVKFGRNLSGYEILYEWNDDVVANLVGTCDDSFIATITSKSDPTKTEWIMNEIFFIDYLKNPTYERGLAAKSKILVCFNDELLAAFLSAYKKANISEQQEMLTILKEISFRGGAVERDETDTEVTRKNLEKLENALNSEVEHTSDAVKKFYANRHLETVKQIRQKFLNTREM